MVSGWPFLLRSTKVFNKSIPSEAEITENDVLRVALHKPLTVLTLNPLVTRSEVLDPTSKPNLYTTHEDIKLLGIKSDIVSTADYDGISLEVHAGFGTMLRMTWKVARNAETGDLEVSETVICRTLFLLHPFIIGTMSKAHAQMIDRLVEKVQENVKATRGEADGSEGKESEVV